MECPKCSINYFENTEQTKAIEKRGRCLACLLIAKEPIKGLNDNKSMIDDDNNYYYSPNYEFIPNGSKINKK